MTSRWNELKKVTYFSAPTRAIFGGTNSEITNTMTNRMHIFMEEEQVGVELHIYIYIYICVCVYIQCDSISIIFFYTEDCANTVPHPIITGTTSEWFSKFEDVEDIQRNLTLYFHTISKEKFHRCFDQRKTYRNKCVEYQGEYFGKICCFIDC